MKLSELASLVEQYVEEHGDLVVAVEMEGALFPAEKLVVGRASIDDFVEDGTTVAYIF